MGDDDYDDDYDEEPASTTDPTAVSSAQHVMPDPTAYQANDGAAGEPMDEPESTSEDTLAELPTVGPGIFKFSAIFGGAAPESGRMRRAARAPAPAPTPLATPEVS